MTEVSLDQYLALPATGNGPGVLVLHAWWGLNDFIRGLCDRLAREGFVALAPDMTGGRVARTVEEAEHLVGSLGEGDSVPPILFSALSVLRSHPCVSGERVAVVGFSFGAFWALWLSAARPEDISAVTVYYGSGGADFRQSKASFQGHFAENDPYEPEEGIRELERMLQAAGRPADFHVYPGTGHWFFESDRPDAYNPEAAHKSWERTLTFLRGHLTGASG